MGTERGREVREIIDRLPYVFSLDHPTWCDGWVKENDKRKKCTNMASWNFRKGSSKGKGVHKSGYFCTYHLVQVLKYSIYEKARVQRAYNKANKVKESI
jgi:hypothetical protein